VLLRHKLRTRARGSFVIVLFPYNGIASQGEGLTGCIHPSPPVAIPSFTEHQCACDNVFHVAIFVLLH